MLREKLRNILNEHPFNHQVGNLYTGVNASRIQKHVIFLSSSKFLYNFLYGTESTFQILIQYKILSVLLYFKSLYYLLYNI